MNLSQKFYHFPPAPPPPVLPPPHEPPPPPAEPEEPDPEPEELDCFIGITNGVIILALQFLQVYSRSPLPEAE